MRRRRGITLIEVLVAIFIMAIGLLAILTLFPLGALRMAEALQDDRAAASASAGANTCDAFGIRNDPIFFSTTTGANLYTNPGAAYGLPTSGCPERLGLSALRRSVGRQQRVRPASAASSRGSCRRSFRRRTTRQPNMAIRYFSLPDDMTFFDNGAPDTSNGAIQRGGRYTWAYLLHRSQPASPTAPVDLTVVVYAGRATSVPGGENTFAAAGNAGDTAVSVSWGAGQPPGIKRGSWILDTSSEKDANGNLVGVNGLFYRVVSVSQPSSNADEPGTADSPHQGR